LAVLRALPFAMDEATWPLATRFENFVLPPLARTAACLTQSSRSIRPGNSNRSPISACCFLDQAAIWENFEMPTALSRASFWGPIPLICFRLSGAPDFAAAFGFATALDLVAADLAAVFAFVGDLDLPDDAGFVAAFGFAAAFGFLVRLGAVFGRAVAAALAGLGGGGAAGVARGAGVAAVEATDDDFAAIITVSGANHW